MFVYFAAPPPNPGPHLTPHGTSGISCTFGFSHFTKLQLRGRRRSGLGHLAAAFVSKKNLSWGKKGRFCFVLYFGLRSSELATQFHLSLSLSLSLDVCESVLTASH